MSRSITHVRRKKKDTDPLRSAWHVLEEWVEVNGRRILTISGIALGAVVLFGLLYYFLEYRHERQNVAFNEAYQKFTATVGAKPATPGFGDTNKVTYPDNQTKYTESAAAFEKLANDYSGYRDVGNYYAALSYFEVQPEKGEQLMQGLATGSSDLKYEARLALAEHYAKTGAFDKSEQYYQQLADDPGKLPRFYILVQLGNVKERLNKPAEAAPLYKQVVDADRNGTFGPDAEKGLQRVDPAAAAALPPKNAAPTNGGPNSMIRQGQAPVNF